MLLEFLSTSYSMKFLALNDDVKFIIATHLASDLKIRTLLSKNHDIQKQLFNDVVFNDDAYVRSSCPLTNRLILKLQDLYRSSSAWWIA